MSYMKIPAIIIVIFTIALFSYPASAVVLGDSVTLVTSYNGTNTTFINDGNKSFDIIIIGGATLSFNTSLFWSNITSMPENDTTIALHDWIMVEGSELYNYTLTNTFGVSNISFDVYKANTLYIIYTNGSIMDVRASSPAGNINIIGTYDNGTLFTIQNYYFSFAHLAYTSPIAAGQPSTITVDITDHDNIIASAIIKIEGKNYTMQYISGTQWRYIYTDTSIIKNHYINNIYATDNAGGTNSTAYSTEYIITLSPAGTGGTGGTLPPTVPPATPPKEVNITLPDITAVKDTLSNFTKGLGEIVSGDVLSMLKINPNPYPSTYTKTITLFGAMDATSVDPNVKVGAVNNEVIILVTPPIDGSLFYQYYTSIDILLDSGIIEHREFSVSILDMMAYIKTDEYTMSNPHPYFFHPTSDSSVDGLRMWWMGLLLLGGVIMVKKRGKK